MTTDKEQYPYRQDVIDFVMVAVETCLLLEHVAEQEKKDFVEKLLHYLPLLYLKTRLLARPEELPEGFAQTCVTEDDYDFVREGVKQLLEQDDAYLEVFVEDMRYSDTPITAFISENVADIYQELKNMAFNYQQGNPILMADAVETCLEAFYEHWGQKLLNCLRALHAIEEF